MQDSNSGNITYVSENVKDGNPNQNSLQEEASEVPSKSGSTTDIPHFEQFVAVNLRKECLFETRTSFPNKNLSNCYRQ